jgi:hypothetical protein
MTDRYRDYEDGFHDGYYGDALDPERRLNEAYWRGTRDGRMRLADEEDHATNANTNEWDEYGET